MNALKQFMPLKSKITVYVPGTVDINKAIDNSAQVRHVAAVLASAFGGATSTPAQGFWMSAAGELVTEQTTMVFAYCTTEQAEEFMPDVLTMCNILCVEMRQEAIALEYNGEMYFIR